MREQQRLLQEAKLAAYWDRGLDPEHDACKDLANVPIIGEGLQWFCNAWYDFMDMIASIPQDISTLASSLYEGIINLPQTLAQGAGKALEYAIGQGFWFVSGNLYSYIDAAFNMAEQHMAAPEAMGAIYQALFQAGKGPFRPGELDILAVLLTRYFDIGKYIVQGLRSVFEYPGPATPEKAMQNTYKFMDLLLALSNAPFAAAAVIDLIYPTKRTWIPDIIRNFYWSLGLGWMTWTIWSQIFRHTILNPLDIWYQERYRDRFPTKSEWEEWFRQNVISTDKWFDGMRKLGYRDEYIQYELQTLWKVPTKTDLIDAYRAGLLLDTELYKHIRRMGYNELDAKMIYHLWLEQAKNPEKKATQSMILESYRLGVVGRQEALNMLIDLGYRPKVAEVMLNLEDAKQAAELQKLNVQVILENLKDGYITAQQAINQLLALGVDSAKAYTLVQLTEAKVRGPERLKLSKSEIINLYEYGIISEQTAIDWLQRLGLPGYAALDLLRLADLKQNEKVKEASRSAIIDAYRLGLLSRHAARQQLINLGYSEGAADLYLALADAKEELSAHEYEVKAIVLNVVEGYISPEEGLRQLQALGVQPEKAKALIKYAEVRYKVEHRERLTKADIKAMFTHGLIDGNEAVNLLVRLGYNINVAKALLEIWKADYLDKVKELSASQILAAYREGLISKQEAARMLEALRYPPEYVKLLLSLEDQKLHEELQKLEIKVVLENLRYGFITPEEAVRQLQQLGVTPERAELLVKITMIKVKAETHEKLTKSDIKLLFDEGLINADTALQLLTKIGYREEVARMLIQAWQNELGTKAKELTTSQVLQLYRAGLLTRQEALNMLVQLGYSERSAALLLQLEDLKMHSKIVELEQKIILEDLKDGYITPDQAVNALVSAGVAPDVAKLLVQYALAEARAKRRQAPNVTQIEKWFKMGYIDENTAIAWLEIIGYTDKVAELFIREWKEEQRPGTRQLTTSTILNAYELGIIDRELAKNWLISIGYTEESAEIILKVEDAKTLQKLVKEKEEVILLKYRYGYITREEAAKELAALGLLPPQIDSMLELEDIRRQKPPEKKHLTVTQLMKAYRLGIVDEKFVDDYLKKLGYTDMTDRLILMLIYGVLSEEVSKTA